MRLLCRLDAGRQDDGIVARRRHLVHARTCKLFLRYFLGIVLSTSSSSSSSSSPSSSSSSSSHFPSWSNGHLHVRRTYSRVAYVAIAHVCHCVLLIKDITLNTKSTSIIGTSEPTVNATGIRNRNLQLGCTPATPATPVHSCYSHYLESSGSSESWVRSHKGYFQVDQEKIICYIYIYIYMHF